THANVVWKKRVNGRTGVPWPDTDARIIHRETVEEADVDEVGEIAVKDLQIMNADWNNPDETNHVLKGGGLLTVDLGYKEGEDYVYVVDRKKDMIIAGGYNIYPREVEEVLYEHEGVQEAVVAGIPDPYRGETTKAYIVLKDGYQPDEAELNAFC